MNDRLQGPLTYWEHWLPAAHRSLSEGTSVLLSSLRYPDTNTIKTCDKTLKTFRGKIQGKQYELEWTSGCSPSDPLWSRTQRTILLHPPSPSPLLEVRVATDDGFVYKFSVWRQSLERGRQVSYWQANRRRFPSCSVPAEALSHVL
jgi:hypothetical protein